MRKTYLLVYVFTAIHNWCPECFNKSCKKHNLGTY